MNMLDKYKVVAKLGGGEIDSFRAEETMTGRTVLLHRFFRNPTIPQQPDLMSMVYKYLSRADAPGIENYLDSGEDEDRVFIVTSDVPECLNLRQWLQSMAIALGEGATLEGPSPAEPGSTQGSAEIKPEPAAKPVGGRLRMPVPGGMEVVFESRKPRPAATRPGESLTPTITAPVQPPAKAAGPEDFSRHFIERKAETSPAPSPLEPGGTHLEPAPPAGKTHPGEFTQMFLGTGKGKTGQPLPTSTPASDKPPSIPARDAGKTGPGEFTQMFKGVGAGLAKQPGDTPLPPPAPSPQSPAEKSGPGEFTQMFNAQQMAKQPAAPPSPVVAKPSAPPAQSGPGEFTQMFNAQQMAKQPAAPPSPVAAKPSAPPVQSGPGEFTRMFRTGGETPLKPQPPVSGPSHAPALPPSGPGAQGHAQQPPTSPVSQGDSRAPSEFTQMFKTGGEPPRSAGLTTPTPPLAPLSSSSKKQAGEFTQMMQGYKPPTATPAAPAMLEMPKPSTPAPATDPGKKAPGEFTMIFRKQSQPVAPAAPAAPPVVQPTPPPPQARQPGEYTSIFEVQRKPPTTPQPAPPAAPPAGYGYPAAPPVPVYAAPPAPMAPQVAYPQAPQFQPPPPPAYAMAPPPIPQMQPMAMPPPPVPVSVPSPGTKKPAIFWILLLCLGCLFLTAVVLVLFFALKH